MSSDEPRMTGNSHNYGSSSPILENRNESHILKQLKLTDKPHHRSDSNSSKSVLSRNISSSTSSGDKFRGPSSPLETSTPNKLYHQLQMSRMQHCESVKKLEVSDAEYYLSEIESTRASLNEVRNEKMRLEHELNSLRLLLEDERKEMSELRRQQQDILKSDNGGESLSIMYGSLLRNYEGLKDDYRVIRKRYDEISASHSSALLQLEMTNEDVLRYKKLYQEMLTERNQFKQQCTQAIRQWDQTLREQNDYKVALSKVQKQHEEAVKEVNQAMTVRIKASKDIKRLTEERNAAMQEYSLIMSERDSVHKEIEKLHEEIYSQKTKMSSIEERNKGVEEERRKFICQIEMLKREIEQSLSDRDKALKEAHELREKLGMNKSEFEAHKYFVNRSKFDLDKLKDKGGGGGNSLLHNDEEEDDETQSRGHHHSFKCDNLEQAYLEIDRLQKLSEKSQSELQDASMEADVAKGRRDLAFSERDKVVLERESIRILCDKLRRERDRAVCDLAEALRDSEAVKKQFNELLMNTKDLRATMNSVENGGDYESIEISVESPEELHFDLCGGRNDLSSFHSTYISAIHKGGEGSPFKVYDTILRVNNVDYTGAEREIVQRALRNASSVTVRRRRRQRQPRQTSSGYTSILHISHKESHGISLENGIYIAKIASGSVADRQDNISVGDRLITINDFQLDSTIGVEEAMEMINHSKQHLKLTAVKTLSSFKCLDKSISPKVNCSPLKDTIRGSQEFVKKILAGAPKSCGGASSSSSERMQSSSFHQNKRNGNTTNTHNHNGSLIETMKEKLEYTVRGKRRTKDFSHQRTSSNVLDPSVFSLHDEGKFRIGSPVETEINDGGSPIVELDSVLNYHSGSSGGGTKSSGGCIDKRKKRSKDRESFHSGGTWPRARGGPIIEQGTGTILHPHKNKKERMPLAELLTNISKGPPENLLRHKLRNEDYSRTHRKSTRPLTTHEFVSNYGCSSLEASSAVKQFLSPSESSIDDSVKSAHAGKEVLERYLKKSKSKSTSHDKSDSDTLSTVEVMTSPPPPLLLTSLTLKKSDSRFIHTSHLLDSGIRYIGNSGISSPPPRYSSPRLPSPPRSDYRALHEPSPYLSQSPSPSLSGLDPRTSRRSSSLLSQYHSLGPLQTNRHSEEASSLSPPHYTDYGTSVRKTGKENNSFSSRIRIPSNTSVTSHGSMTKLSTSSIDRPQSKCSGILPIYSIQYLGTDGRVTENSCLPPRKPRTGEIRQIYIEKSSEQLGIMIEQGSNKGVFVSSVSENSLAQLVGLHVGDQLLDVCGINLRSCGKEQAAVVLHQVGNSITLKVQFNPEDFEDEEDPENEEDENEEGEEEHGSSSVSDTSDSEEELRRQRRRRRRRRRSSADSLTPQSSLLRDAPPPSYSALMHRTSVSPPYEPRTVSPVMKKSGDLGVRLVGGNAVGIFIHSVEIDSAAYLVGVRCADQILEYNNIDLRSATAEQAAYELAKPAEKVSLTLQYNPDKYQRIKDEPGDSYYVRSMFDRLPEYSIPPQLSFRKDDILYIDNTMYNGVPGHWSAWLVTQDGSKGPWGIIPSKYKVEEELLMKRSLGELDLERRQWTSTTTIRRSFFKRKKVSRSRDFKELASYSDMGSLNLSDYGNLQEDTYVQSYIRVERLDICVSRPVLILGPLSDAIMDKLSNDYPHKFSRVEPEIMDLDPESLEKGLVNNVLIDYKRRGSNRFECLTIQSIRNISERNQHCILNIHLESLERLHLNRIYPIVLLIKFKSVKQIKEVKDPRYHGEKISHKDAKNIFEHTQKLEMEYKPLISDIIHAGANLMLMCAQIASKIDQEQAKTLWVPYGTIW